MCSKLPWFIWKEIMEFTVGIDQPEYCLVNKTWFKTVGGRFINVMDVVDSGLQANFSINRWYVFQSEEIKLKQFGGIDWSYLAKFQSIKHAHLQFLYSQPADNLATCFEKFNTLFQLQALTLEFTKESIAEVSVVGLLKGQTRVKYLYLDIEGLESVYNTIFEGLTFKYLTSFKFRCRSDLVSQTKINRSMPQLKYLHLIFSSFDSVEIYQQDCVMRGLIGLRIECENDRLVTVDLDLSYFPNLKRVSIPRETNFIASKPIELCPQIETLDLSHPNQLLLNKVSLIFPHLTSLSINCYDIDTGMLTTIFNLLPRLHSLTLYELATDTLLISFKPHNTNLKYLKIDGYCYLTNQFILWLSEHFMLFKLHLKYFTDGVTSMHTNLNFENLESVVLEYIEVFNTTNSIELFSNAQFPNLKFVIKKRFNASSTRSNNQRYAYIKGITG